MAVIQKHHIIYGSEKPKQEEVVVRITKGQHYILTLLNRQKNISPGFIKSIKVWLALNEDKAKEISE